MPIISAATKTRPCYLHPLLLLLLSSSPMPIRLPRFLRKRNINSDRTYSSRVFPRQRRKTLRRHTSFVLIVLRVSLSSSPTPFPPRLLAGLSFSALISSSRYTTKYFHCAAAPLCPRLLETELSEWMSSAPRLILKSNQQENVRLIFPLSTSP